MAKIMLVEDDNNLREIYEARLLAEGHEIISAHDGEEALALAVKEKPELIISDVMMPKISGFDMLDILRDTPETRNTKVIMMTALSQTEDKDRADKLGADRYLVKSQVTLEDVVRVAREVLEGKDASAPVSAANETPQATASIPEPVAVPDQPTPVAAMPVAVPPADPSATVADPPAQDTVISDQPAIDPSLAAAAEALSEAVSPAPADDASSSSPTTDTLPPVTEAEGQASEAQTTASEQETVKEQVNDFVSSPSIAVAPIEVSPDGTVTSVSPDAAVEPAPPQPQDLQLPASEPLPSQVPAEPATTAPEVPPAVLDTPDTATPAGFPQAAEAQAAPAEQSSAAFDPTASASHGDDSITAAKKVIQPLNDPFAKPDLDALAAKEQEREQISQIIGNAGVAPPPPQNNIPGTPPPTAEDSKGQDPNMIAL